MPGRRCACVGLVITSMLMATSRRHIRSAQSAAIPYTAASEFDGVIARHHRITYPLQVVVVRRFDQDELKMTSGYHIRLPRIYFLQAKQLRSLTRQPGNHPTICALLGPTAIRMRSLRQRRATTNLARIATDVACSCCGRLLHRPGTHADLVLVRRPRPGQLAVTPVFVPFSRNSRASRWRRHDVLFDLIIFREICRIRS